MGVGGVRGYLTFPLLPPSPRRLTLRPMGTRRTGGAPAAMAPSASTATPALKGNMDELSWLPPVGGEAGGTGN